MVSIDWLSAKNVLQAHLKTGQQIAHGAYGAVAAGKLVIGNTEEEVAIKTVLVMPDRQSSELV